MAHFAKIGDTSKVLAVLTLNNKAILNADGVEEESVGQKYLEKHNNWPAEKWIQTSYNTLQNKHSSGDNSKALRGNYAGLSYAWDEGNQIFWPPKPYPSWVKNTTDARWHSPIGDAPDLGAEIDTHTYAWNEDNQSWDKKSV
jgi:hypothetical protein